MKIGQTLILLFALHWLFAQSYPVGTRSTSFSDPSRNNRSIACDTYYPATSAGNNAPLAQGVFPYVVFGHGFLMAASAYEPIASALAAQGFVVFLPTTELGLFPSHTNFARDLAFVGAEAYDLSENNSGFFFHESLSDLYAVGGHSMGGGCTYLSWQYQTTLAATCLFTFAAAETNPSAINEMGAIDAPNLLLAGSLDCVTPPANHQIPMYEAQSEEACKQLVTITGGYHCQFNNSNFNCSLGENSCSPPGGISRQAQLDLTLSLMIPWLQAWLNPDCEAWQSFEGLMNAPSGYTVSRACALADINNPIIDYAGSLERCPEDPITLTALPGEGSITWNTGQTGPEITPLVSGTFYYTVSNGVCENQSPSVTVTYQDPINAVVSGVLPDPLCPGMSFELLADPPIGSVTWSDGTTGYGKTVTESGAYSFVLESGGCTFYSDTLWVEYPEAIFPVIQFAGLPVLCPGDQILLEAIPAQGSVTWSNGASGFSILAEEAGMYYFQLDSEGCTYLSDVLEITQPDPGELEILFPGARAICDGHPVVLHAQHPGGTTLWNNGVQGSTLETSLPGAYWYELYLESCVFESDTVWIAEILAPSAEVEAEKNKLCPGESLWIAASYEGGFATWNNGSSMDSILVNQAGVYFFTLDTLGCLYQSDTLELNSADSLPLAIVVEGSLPLCEGDVVLLLSSTEGGKAMWSTGETGDTLFVGIPGIYYYTIDSLGCLYKSDSIQVDVVSKPESTLLVTYEPPLCFSSSEAFLEIIQEDGAVLWQDGDTSKRQRVTDTGLFAYDILNENCVFEGDSVFLEFYAQWLKEPASILGEQDTEPGQEYTYTASVLDPHLEYHWTLSEGDAQIIGIQNARQVLIKVNPDARAPVILECLLRDTLCQEERNLTRILRLNTSSVNENPSTKDLIIYHSTHMWTIEWKGNSVVKTALYDVTGRQVLEKHVNGKNCQIEKTNLKPGLYLLYLISETGNVQGVARLVHY